MLQIQNLHVSIDNTEIIKGLNLLINTGEIHAIMGKNGSGKSTLAKSIAGHPQYNITKGKIILDGNDITQEEPEKRSHHGVFLAFQYPIEIPGVSNTDFLRLAYNAKNKFLGQSELDPLSFFELINSKIKNIDMNQSFLTRNVNEGFSGGEKKKNEILQMSLLQPKISILDEIDSGLDIDALKNISSGINQIKFSKNSFLMITHYQRLLNYIKPDYIHIMHNGKITYTGDSTTAQKIEKYGYDIFT
uniref:Probable ATP-dependent transporter ycf16 n=1 Tax=Sphondylothamnion multifidum TaxID=193186 RepID=A0A4D6WZ39_9FLOR|nr:iron-sulfur cluster formation ABC transporter ATP-binding subunit [Sphondylothamnion multifidum]